MEEIKIKELRKKENNKEPKLINNFGWLNPVNKGGFYTYMIQEYCISDNCFIDVCRDEEDNFFYVPQSESLLKANYYCDGYQFCVSNRGV